MDLYEALLRVRRWGIRTQLTGDTFAYFPLAQYFRT